MRGVGSGLFESALRGGGVYLALFLGVHVVLVAASEGVTPLSVLELALIGVPAANVTLRRRLGPRVTALSVAALVLAALLGTWSLPVVPAAALGYAGWHFGAITFVLLGLAIYGRYGAAWLVLAAMAAMAVAWTTLTGLGPLDGLGLVVRHAGTLLVGTLFAVGVNRVERRESDLQRQRRREQAAESSATARASARRSAVERVLEQAGPMLRRIADGRPLSEVDRRELLVIEGALRDQIRAPGLLHGPLRDSVAAARRRGVNVLLLDDTEDPAEHVPDDLAAWLVTELDRTGGTRFVGHVRRASGAVSISAVTDEGSRSASFATADG